MLDEEFFVANLEDLVMYCSLSVDICELVSEIYNNLEEKNTENFVKAMKNRENEIVNQLWFYIEQECELTLRENVRRYLRRT